MRQTDGGYPSVMHTASGSTCCCDEFARELPVTGPLGEDEQTRRAQPSVDSLERFPQGCRRIVDSGMSDDAKKLV